MSHPPAWVPPLPPRPRDAHKGTMGRLLIVGGSPGMTGAVALAAAAALRSGTGLVTCAVPAALNPILEVKTTEAMTLPLPDSDTAVLLPESLSALEAHLEAANAVVVGPGMGRHPKSSEFLRALLAATTVPHLVDADGLWHLSRERDTLKRGHPTRVLTPHPGEMERLRETLALSPGEREPLARAFVQEVPGVLVLKGAGTLVATSGELRENSSGNPGLATGGTGDVLAGIAGAFLARGDSPFDAALRAVWLHGRAADLAVGGVPDREETAIGEESLIASDVIQSLPRAFRELHA